MIVSEIQTISTFKPYKKNYNNLTEIHNAAKIDTALNYALNFVISQPILKGTDIMFAVEWANDPKLTVYRFYAENTTHTFELVIDYLTQPLANFTLSYQWACRQNVKFGSCTGTVNWNNHLIENITPSDYNIHNSSFSVNV